MDRPIRFEITGTPGPSDASIRSAPDPNSSPMWLETVSLSKKCGHFSHTLDESTRGQTSNELRWRSESKSPRRHAKTHPSPRRTIHRGACGSGWLRLSTSWTGASGRWRPSGSRTWATRVNTNESDFDHPDGRVTRRHSTEFGGGCDAHTARMRGWLVVAAVLIAFFVFCLIWPSGRRRLRRALSLNRGRPTNPIQATPGASEGETRLRHRTGEGKNRQKHPPRVRVAQRG